ncbi:hypothetical protein GA0070616_2593 [Micromonospora nigra]|uniref:Uncharacterized protein n=1 Tax=Micromonospora nigra TaxID=145857 RepID=A0A1C6S047_9ACTN|nr:hypothetical protein GA0070616_2593 [Micromonospora nigra]
MKQGRPSARSWVDRRTCRRHAPVIPARFGWSVRTRQPGPPRTYEDATAAWRERSRWTPSPPAPHYRRAASLRLPAATGPRRVGNRLPLLVWMTDACTVQRRRPPVGAPPLPTSGGARRPRSPAPVPSSPMPRGTKAGVDSEAPAGGAAWNQGRR